MLRDRLAVVAALLVLGACDASDDAGDPDADIGADASPADASDPADAPTGTVDAAVADAAKIDAPRPDADTTDATPADAFVPPIVTSLTCQATAPGCGPGDTIIARGFAMNFIVTLDQVAPSAGTVVTLSSDDVAGTHLSLPASVIVPQGLNTNSFMVTGTQSGGPFVVTASLNGSSGTASAWVIPAMVDLTPATADLTLGTSGVYTVTLENVAPIDLVISIGNGLPATLSMPMTVTMPMNATQVSFEVASFALGGPTTFGAVIGGQSVRSVARVSGLFLSEIFYDPAGTDSTKEWVELYNASGVTIDVAGMLLQSATAATYSTALTLTGTIPAGGCVVVGGPDVGAFAFSYFQAIDFNPGLGNVTAGADAIQLVTPGGSIIDNVIYGGANTKLIPDENGLVPAGSDVGDAGSDQSIERTAPGLNGPWQILPVPTPGDCTPISS